MLQLQKLNYVSHFRHSEDPLLDGDCIKAQKERYYAATRKNNRCRRKTWTAKEDRQIIAKRKSMER